MCFMYFFSVIVIFYTLADYISPEFFCTKNKKTDELMPYLSLKSRYLLKKVSNTTLTLNLPICFLVKNYVEL